VGRRRAFCRSRGYVGERGGNVLVRDVEIFFVGLRGTTKFEFNQEEKNVFRFFPSKEKGFWRSIRQTRSLRGDNQRKTGKYLPFLCSPLNRRVRKGRAGGQGVREVNYFWACRRAAGFDLRWGLVYLSSPGSWSRPKQDPSLRPIYGGFWSVTHAGCGKELRERDGGVGFMRRRALFRGGSGKGGRGHGGPGSCSLGEGKREGRF